MNKQQFDEILKRQKTAGNPVDVGDKVIAVDHMTNRRTSGTVTSRDGEAIWLDGETSIGGSGYFWRVDVRRDEPTEAEDIKALANVLSELFALLPQDTDTSLEAGDGAGMDWDITTRVQTLKENAQLLLEILGDIGGTSLIK